MWGNDAIRVINDPQPDHQFNFQEVGRGDTHDVLNPGGNRCSIQIWVGTMMRPPLLRERLGVDCHVNTDMPRSIFQGEVARKLNLPEPYPMPVRGGPQLWNLPATFWCERVVWINLVGQGYVKVPVSFPIRRVSGRKGGVGKWDWRMNYLPFNILGMEFIWDRHMLCFTPERLFIFDRRTRRAHTEPSPP